MAVEDEYQDVLQNIEFAIVSVYRSNSALLDYDVRDALEALIRYYRSQSIGREPDVPQLGGKPQDVLLAVKQVCEMRLGRADAADTLPIGITPLSIDELVTCLKRIVKSVDRWNKQNGRKGYLDFVSDYIV